MAMAPVPALLLEMAMMTGMVMLVAMAPVPALVLVMVLAAVVTRCWWRW